MIDFIIVGQGIAGTTLAFQLIKNGYTVHVIDSNPNTSSSKIASGLWNPVVLKRMKKVWMADEMLHCLLPFYQDLQNTVGGQFIKNQKVIRAFNNAEEVNQWVELSDSKRFENILNPQTKPLKNQAISNPFGCGEVSNSGRIDVAQMLLQTRKWLEQNNNIQTLLLDYKDIDFKQDVVSVKGLKAKHLVFCEGHQATNNPWFKYLPFSCTKGEVLIGKSEELKLNQPLNGGKFILPLGQDQYKVGATYNWHHLDEIPSPKGKEELLKGWSKITNAPFITTSHLAGIRPNVKDRRPLLGTHPEIKNAHVFNGLGSRGILMAPYLTQCFLEFIQGKKNLNPEMDIKRFYPLFL